MKALLVVLALTGCSVQAAGDAPAQDVPAPDPMPVSTESGPVLTAEEPSEPMATAPTVERRAIELMGTFAQGGFGRGQVRGGEATEILMNGEPIPMADDGGFFVAFGRDAGAPVQLQARYADGETIAQDFAIADTDFPESHLPPITQRIEASDGFKRRRAEQVARITAARAGRSVLTGWQEDFVRPAQGRTSGVFGSQRFYGDEPRSPHSGMDIAAPAGATVSAPASGRVVLAGGGYSFEGNLVIVDHGLGLYSAFLHLSKIDVKVGDMLAQGDVIGAVGASGRVTGPHLHWGLWWDGVRFDPAILLAAG